MAKQKVKSVSDENIIEYYTDYVLVNGKKPNSVYEFAKNNSFEEVDFYKFYASFEALEEQYFSNMFQYTYDLIYKSKEFGDYDASQKLSTFYFTFIEMASLNRSFVKFLLEQGKMPLKNISKLKLLRHDFKNFVKAILETPIKTDIEKIASIQNRLVHEGAWIQFLSIIKYWLDDTSKGFEKTDVFIEKSIKASFDIVYNVPIESIIDFGKFLWKEKMNR